ncbi:MAG TPA: glutamate mutase L [Catenuloplanes sp.]
MSALAVCADVGSTYTKVAVVDVGGAELVATAQRPTTVDTDVLHGLDAAVAATGVRLAAGTPWYVCSSAGGGLRLAVVGYQELVTARAGHRVGLSAGALVVHVAAGRLGGAEVAGLRAARPDVVLLVGGTDGGDGEVLVHNAARLGAARWRVPVVVAGNVAVREQVVAALAGAGVPVTAAANVLPRIGVLAAASARAAIREVFLRHVIGGKRLSRGGRFAALVRAATPDAVLSAVELLADVDGADLLVVDVGGATTDVYSALTPDPEQRGGPRAEVTGTLWRSRTVEGDLGVRRSGPAVVAAALAERLLAPDDPLVADPLVAGPVGGAGAGDGRVAVERRLAVLAATVALRRHARGPDATVGGRGGRDLRRVRLVVGSGGVLRHAAAPDAVALLDAALADDAGAWARPAAARTVIDHRYVLAAGGLLAADHPAAAVAVLRRYLPAG